MGKGLPAPFPETLPNHHFLGFIFGLLGSLFLTPISGYIDE